MPSSLNEDLLESMAVFLGGMAVPFVVVALFHGYLSLYLDGGQFTVLAAGAFTLVAWFVVETFDPDGPNFLVAAVFGPGLAFLLIFGYGMTTGGAGVAFQYLFTDVGFITYPAAFGVAGFVAVGLSKKVRSLAARHERVPDPRVLIGAVGLVVVVAVVLLLAVNLAAASSVSVTSVTAGTERIQDPTLNVTVAGGTAELRVTAVAPDGTSVTKRLSWTDMDGGQGTASFRIWPEDSSPPDTLPATTGTYRIRVTGLSGVTVDTATFEADEGRDMAITDRTAAVGQLTWSDPAPEEVYERYRYETKVGVVVENRGAFHSEVAATLETPDGMENIRARSLFLEPDGRVGVAFAIPDDVAESIRTNHDGTVTVSVVRTQTGTEVATVDVELPEE